MSKNALKEYPKEIEDVLFWLNSAQQYAKPDDYDEIEAIVESIKQTERLPNIAMRAVRNAISYMIEKGVSHEYPVLKDLQALSASPDNPEVDICERCANKKGYTTGIDEYPQNAYLERCSKGHWENSTEEIVQELDGDFMDYCEDFCPDEPAEQGCKSSGICQKVHPGCYCGKCDECKDSCSCQDDKGAE